MADGPKKAHSLHREIYTPYLVDELLSLPVIRSLISWNAEYVIDPDEGSLNINNTVADSPVKVDLHAGVGADNWFHRAQFSNGAFHKTYLSMMDPLVRDYPSPRSPPYYELGSNTGILTRNSRHGDVVEICWENNYWCIEAVAVVTQYRYYPRLVFEDDMAHRITHKNTGDVLDETLARPKRRSKEYSIRDLMLWYPEKTSLRYERDREYEIQKRKEIEEDRDQ